MTTPSAIRMDKTDAPTREGVRFDRAALRAPRRQADGSIVADAFVAKPGILEYRQADGSTLRELVPASTLHDVAALDSLRLRPVTLEHPDGERHPDMVTPANVGELGVGTVGEDVAADDDGAIRFRVVIHRRDAIDWIESRQAAGKPIEVSPGYRVTVDPTPGIDPIFGSYDAIQVKRDYNHLALTAAARGGSTVRLRADAAEQVGRIEQRSDAVTLLESLIAAGTSRADALKIVKAIDDGTITARLDGAASQALEDAIGAHKAKVDELGAALAKMQKEKEEEDAAASVEEEEEEDPEKVKAKADALFAAVDELAAVRDLAIKFDGLRDVDGRLTVEARKLDAAGLRSAVLGAAGIKVPTDLTGRELAAYTRARLDGLEVPAARLADDRDSRLDGLRFTPADRTDGKIDKSPDPRARFDSLGGYHKLNTDHLATPKA